MGAGRKSREGLGRESGRRVRSASVVEHGSKEALQASEDKFRALFENGSDGILIADVATKTFRYANPAAVRMLGYSENELRTMGVADIHPPEYVQAALAGFEAKSVAGGPLAIDVPCLRKGGTVVYADINATPITVDGRAMNAGFFRDVTERWEAKRALEASETRYRRLFESAKDGILILDAATGRIVDVNPLMMELTGHSRSDFLEKNLWEIGPFKDIAAAKASFAELQEKGYVRYEDLPLATRAGGTIDVEFISNVYVVGDRKVIQCNVRDITARKRAETERQRLATAIDQAAEAIMVTDARGAILYVNPAFETVTGYSRSEAIGLNPSMLKSGKQDDAFYGSLWATISGGHIWRGRLVNKKKDGTLFTEEATISPVRDAAGTTTSYVAVKRDVSASLALEAQFLQAQKMEAVGRLAGGVAHDFNNILSVILSYADFLSGEVAEPARTDVEEIRTAALRAAALTRQLLAFSRQLVLEPRVLNLNQTVTQLEKMIVRLLGADVKLTTLLGAGLWNVKADPGKIEQILMNLAVNARDAMPTGGQLTIETRNVELDDDYARAHDVPAGSYALVAVTDTGVGMDAETKARLFEPFFTTKERGKGTGLGLATVFWIVKQSGGHIWVYSEPGKGATFKVYFPRAVGAAQVHPSEPPAREAVRGSETILLVEDDDQVRAVAAGILRRNGYVVLDASNGGEALLVCEQHEATIHLLLTDVVMPRMSGRQLAERLASLRPEMKVLFMSGYTDDAILQHGVLDSGVAYLEKPLTPALLTRKVREVLAGGSVA
jgi:two-component system, cell cycle sensor histidine kinase and response regulator CckA